MEATEKPVKVLVVSDIANNDQYTKFNHLINGTENDIVITINDRVPITNSHFEQFCYKDDTHKTTHNLNIYRHDAWNRLGDGELDLGIYIVVTNMSVDQAIACKDFIHRAPAIVICNSSSDHDTYGTQTDQTWFISSGASPTSELYYLHMLVTPEKGTVCVSAYHSHEWYFKYQKRR